jgi:hypothetical protein
MRKIKNYTTPYGTVEPIQTVETPPGEEDLTLCRQVSTGNTIALGEDTPSVKGLKEGKLYPCRYADMQLRFLGENLITADGLVTYIFQSRGGQVVELSFNQLLDTILD